VLYIQLPNCTRCQGGTDIPKAISAHRGKKQDVNQCVGTRCSDPNAPDVTCGGPFANTVYVWKGKDGRSLSQGNGLCTTKVRTFGDCFRRLHA
jgi:hypothetical protein